MCRTILFLGIFISSLFASDFTPMERCDYKSEKFWIKILSLCPEGDLACDKMVYVSVNKNNGDYIVLKGESLVDSKQNFKGYSFKNGEYEYNIFRNNTLHIAKNGKLVQEITLDECKEQ